MQIYIFISYTNQQSIVPFCNLFLTSMSVHRELPHFFYSCILVHYIVVQQCVISLIFLVTTLLRYNSHTIHSTHLKCTTQCFLYIRKRCETHHHNQFLEYCHHSQKKFCTISSDSTFPPNLPSPRQPPIYFLSLHICLFWTCGINRIIQHVVLCECLLSLSIMFSSSIHVAVCFRT